MAAEVRVETVALEAGNRRISARVRTSEALHERAAELEEAIAQASSIAQESLARVPRRDGWQVSGMEVTFGLTLAAEAGVILSKASAEASFGVTLTVERVPEGRAPERDMEFPASEQGTEDPAPERDTDDPAPERDTENP
ncbi:CU044_2847 family protein [Streptomyces sp. NPDC052114]|uniref:CU044_2847 family protein n=1 Tax=unclassified Streptomyces TaxID=2593676 RepID=UPI003436ADB7